MKSRRFQINGKAFLMCFIDELKHENFLNYKIYRKNKRKKEEDCLKLIECTECENSQPSGCEENVPPTSAEMAK